MKIPQLCDIQQICVDTNYEFHDWSNVGFTRSCMTLGWGG